MNTGTINSNSPYIRKFNEGVYTSQPNQSYFFKKLAETAFIRPVLTTAIFTYRTAKNLTLVPLMSLVVAAREDREASKDYFAQQTIKTVKSVRDIIVTPLKLHRIVLEMRTATVEYRDDNRRMLPRDYLRTDYRISYQHFSSENFPNKNVKIIIPDLISELPAISDPSLKAVKASHFLQPGILGLDFGCPNVALFTTKEPEEKEEAEVITVDAKSLKRADMVIKETGGKMQSGLFFIATNLPTEAQEACETAAKSLEGRRDLSCVNTTCRVLKAAGFTVEGIDLENCYLPAVFMEHLLYRNIYFNGQLVHFDLVKTTPLSIEEYLQKIDTATLTTPLRHWVRNSDTDEAKNERSRIANETIAKEAELLQDAEPAIWESLQAPEGFVDRQVKVGISSFLGNFAARFWGRHTVFELDLSDKTNRIQELFGKVLLKPFPDEKPSLATRIKRDYLFSKRAITFLRGHMIGNQEADRMGSRDFLRLLKNTNGVRLNYVLLGDRVIIARVHVATTKVFHKDMADWALSKHALLANREDVNSSGEFWYDRTTQKFYINNESGTYRPDEERLQKTVSLANEVFGVDCFEAALA